MNNFSSAKGNSYAVVIGGSNVDICGKSDGSLIDGESNKGAISLSVGGVARNIADNLARLGGNCHLISAVGDDDFAEYILKKTAEAGVNISSVLKSNACASSTYMSLIDHGGEMACAVNDMAAVSLISPALIEEHASLVQNSKVIVIDANLPEESLNLIANTFKDHWIIADGVSSRKVMKFSNILGSINCLKVNLAEARALSGSSNASPDAVASWLQGQGCENVFITLGREGVYYCTGAEQGIQDAIKDGTDIENVTGAGDAFVAGLALGYLEDWSAKKIVEFANSAAFIAAQSVETINPNMSLPAVMEIME